MPAKKQPEDGVENAVGVLYRELYKLRQAKQYQEEYDAMGSLINMLTVDRQFIRKNYPVEI